ncbi:MAG: hypothetical protein ACKVUT_13570, partial [Gaiella sp.]
WPIFAIAITDWRTRTLRPGGGLSIDYSKGFFLTSSTFSHTVLRAGKFDSVVAPKHRLADVFTAPFFYVDRQHSFFVEPAQSIVKIPQYGGIGVPIGPELNWIAPPDIYLVPEPRLEDIIPELNLPYPSDIYRGVFDPRPIDSVTTFVRDSNIKVAINSVGTFALDDQVFSPHGAVDFPERNNIG